MRANTRNPAERAAVIMYNCNKNGAALVSESRAVIMSRPPSFRAFAWCDYFFTVAALVAAADAQASEGEVKMLWLP
jgi:hypothetical protein